MQIEAMERGWLSSDTFVCDDCVDDAYLKQLVAAGAHSAACDYCGKQASAAIAAPFADLLDVVYRTITTYYGEPAQAGRPRDSGEWLNEEQIVSTCEVLDELGVTSNAKLLDDIAAAIINDAWYPCANGHWLSYHPHEELYYGWLAFSEEVKRRKRYFFSGATRNSDGVGAYGLLRRLADAAHRLKMVRTLKSGMDLWRARVAARDVEIATFNEIGPPPPEKAAGGRMNPPGISYFYLSLDRRTAAGEVAGAPPCALAIGKFRTKVDIPILDLVNLPSLPSIFDLSRKDDRETLLFFKKFVFEISRPVMKDGREHVEYIPSQIVCEFFAHEARFGERQLAGILYPSAIRAGGTNLVLFPSFVEGGWGEPKWNQIVSLVGICELEMNDWKEFADEIL